MYSGMIVPFIPPWSHEFFAATGRLAQCRPGRGVPRPGGPLKVLWVLVAVHLLVVALVVAWPLLFGRQWDAVFLAIVMVIMLHWTVIKGECLLSYLEKCCVYVDYDMGEAPLRHWFHDALPPAAALWVCVAFCLVVGGAVLAVLLRNIRLTVTSLTLEILTPPPLVRALVQFAGGRL